MRQQPYKIQGRVQKISREESAGRQTDLLKVNSYTPGQWKSYIPHEISLSSEKRSSRTPSYYANAYPSSRNGYEPNYQSNEEDSRVKSILNKRRQEEKKRQEMAIRKVKELQDRVLPLVKGRDEEDDGVLIGWQSRIEQKLIRLEGQIENVKKEIELEMERRILQLEMRWENKLTQYYKSVEQTN